MRLESIYLKNFCLFYGEHTVELSAGVNYIVSTNLDDPETYESNACGKSSIIFAISYALFGQAPDGSNGASLISHMCGPKEFMQVILTFSGGVEVTRSYFPHRRRSEVALKTEGGDVVDDPSIVGKKIQEFFRVTPHLFNSALFLSQRDSTATQFLSAPPAQRSKILSDLIDDRVWQQAGKLLATDAAALDSEFTAATSQLQVHSRNLQTLELRLANITESLQTAAKAEEERKQSLRERFARLRELIAQETAVEGNAPKTDPARLEAKRVELMKRQQTLLNELKELPSVAPPLGLGVTCPTCQSVVEAETVERVLAKRERVQKSRDAKKAELDLTNRELTAVQGMQQKARDWKARMELAGERRARYKTELAHVENDLKAPMVSLIALAEQERDLKQQVREQKAEIAEMSKRTVEIGEKSQRLARLAKGFKFELRNLLFDRIRGDLEKYTASYLYNLAGKSMHVEYPSGEGCREKFDILVYREGVAQELKRFSGGEFWRATLAILFALRDVLILKSGCQLPLLLVDDPVGPVDPIGLTNFFSALQGLVDSGSAPTILVTLPNEELATSGNVLRLVREKGITQVA